MPKATHPQFPEAGRDEALTKHPTLRNSGSRLRPSEAAAHFFAEIKFDPASKLQMRPWSLPAANFGRAVEDDVARQMKFGARGPFPSSAQLFFAQTRLVAAAESATALDSFGLLGADCVGVVNAEPRNSRASAGGAECRLAPGGPRPL